MDEGTGLSWAGQGRGRGGEGENVCCEDRESKGSVGFRDSAGPFDRTGVPSILSSFVVAPAATPEQPGTT